MSTPKISVPKISVNDRLLNDGQIQTLRLALGCLRLDLHDESAQGRRGLMGTQNISEHLRHLEALTELIGVVES